MTFAELKFLILAQIGIDLAIIILFILLVRTLRQSNAASPLQRGVKIFESLLGDADRIAEQFRQQLEEKQNLINRINEKLDKRIISLNELLNRADTLLSVHGEEAVGASDNLASSSPQQTEIIELAKKGHDFEEIADILSIPKGEVKLILDLNERFTQIGHKEG